MNDKLVEQLSRHELEIDFIELELTQRTAVNPIVYKGLGSVYQTNTGGLELKFYYRFKDVSDSMKPKKSSMKEEVGKLISDESFFDLTAIDIYGKVWESKKLYMPEMNSLFPSAGKVVKIPLESIYHSKSILKRDPLIVGKSYICSPEKDVAVLLIPGQFDLPFNEYTDTKTSSILNKLKILLEPKHLIEMDKQPFEAIYTQKDRFLQLEIVASPDRSIDLEVVEHFRRSIEFLLGKVCNQVLFTLYAGCNELYQIFSYNKNFPNKSLPVPIKYQSIVNFKDFEKALICLMGCKKSFDVIYGYWHKSHRAFQGDIENGALSLTVSIEGLINYFYKKYGLPDSDQKKFFDECLDIVNALPSDRKLIEKLISSINYANKFSVNKAIFELIELGVLSKKQAKDWKDLRNKSAHADPLNPDRKSLQKQINRYYSSLSVFYKLILSEVGYTGFAIDYSSPGWPDQLVKPLKK